MPRSREKPMTDTLCPRQRAARAVPRADLLSKMFASLLLLGAAQGTPAPPNFVVVLLDDVGRDKVAAYGVHPQPAATPHLDRLAERGTLFRNAWAYSSCSPTRAALLTGRLAERTGIGSVIRAGDGVDSSLARDEFTIAAALPEHRAISLGKWHLSDTADAALHASTLGFDAFAGWDGPNQYFTWTDNVNGALQTRVGYYPLALAERAVRVVANQREPYFLYYCPWLAHAPFHEPPAFLHPTLQGPGSSRFLHLQMVESLDTLLGRLLDQIDLDTTYVIVMGDNGSPLNTTAPPFLPGRIKGSSYEGGLAVPLIVAGPGVAAGAECDRLVHVTDLFATIVELAAAPAPPRGAEDSVSFARLLADPGGAPTRTHLTVSKFGFPGLTQNVPTFRAVRTTRWKYVDDGAGGGERLHDLERDPFETVNLLGATPAPTARALADRLAELLPDLP